MLSRWFRGGRAFPLALASWLLAAGPLGPLGLRHAETPDDPECGSSVAALAHETALAMGRTPAGAARDHCAVCHWMQSFRLGLSPAGQGDGPVEVATPLTNLPIARSSALTAGSLPARAPPASPLAGF